MGTHGNIDTFLFFYSSVSRTYDVSNVNIDMAMIKNKVLGRVLGTISRSGY